MGADAAAGARAREQLPDPVVPLHRLHDVRGARRRLPRRPGRRVRHRRPDGDDGDSRRLALRHLLAASLGGQAAVAAHPTEGMAAEPDRPRERFRVPAEFGCDVLVADHHSQPRRERASAFRRARCRVRQSGAPRRPVEHLALSRRPAARAVAAPDPRRDLEQQARQRPARRSRPRPEAVSRGELRSVVPPVRAGHLPVGRTVSAHSRRDGGAHRHRQRLQHRNRRRHPRLLHPVSRRLQHAGPLAGRTRDPRRRCGPNRGQRPSISR